MRLTSSSEKQGGGETRAEADQDQHRPRGRALFPRQTGTRADQVAERHKGRPGPARQDQQDQDQHRPRGRALFPRQTGAERHKKGRPGPGQSGTRKADQDWGRAAQERQTRTGAERHKKGRPGPARPGPAQTEGQSPLSRADQGRPSGRALSQNDVTPPGPVLGQCRGRLRAKVSRQIIKCYR